MKRPTWRPLGLAAACAVAGVLGVPAVAGAQEHQDGDHGAPVETTVVETTVTTETPESTTTTSTTAAPESTTTTTTAPESPEEPTPGDPGDIPVVNVPSGGSLTLSGGGCVIGGGPGEVVVGLVPVVDGVLGGVDSVILPPGTAPAGADGSWSLTVSLAGVPDGVYVAVPVCRNPAEPFAEPISLDASITVVVVGQPGGPPSMEEVPDLGKAASAAESKADAKPRAVKAEPTYTG